MPWRRKRERSDEDPLRRAFHETVDHIEEAKASLVAVVPAGRAPGAPLAESLVAFEEGLSAAEVSMASWRTDSTEGIWERCRRGIREALERAEKLRLAAPTLDYESLVMTLGRLMEPLDIFEEADRELERD